MSPVIPRPVPPEDLPVEGLVPPWNLASLASVASTWKSVLRGFVMVGNASSIVRAFVSPWLSRSSVRPKLRLADRRSARRTFCHISADQVTQTSHGAEDVHALPSLLMQVLQATCPSQEAIIPAGSTIKRVTTFRHNQNCQKDQRMYLYHF